MNKSHILWPVLAGCLALVVVLLLAAQSPVRANSQAVASATTPYPNCRYGVAAWGSQYSSFDIVANLNAGWYLDFGRDLSAPGPSNAEYVRMLAIYQGAAARGGTDVCGPDYAYTITPSLTDSDLGIIVDANPGKVWIVGNEPDRKIVQNDTCPQQYAQAYHDVYTFIKGRDPKAQIAFAGLVQVTPGRLQYMDIVWNTYLQKYGVPMPVDVWTIHTYVLSETPTAVDDGGGDANVPLGTDPALAIRLCNSSNPIQPCIRYADHDNIDLFKQQIVLMRDWMKRHGEQNKPLLITEYGILLPYNYYGTCSAEVCPTQGLEGCFCDETKRTFHPKRVATFMTNTFSYLGTATDLDLGYPADGYRLIQQWLWYSLQTDGLGHASNLMALPTFSLTFPGQTWHDYVAAISPTVNLFPATVPAVAASAPNGSDPVTVTLAVEVMSNGNTAANGLMSVTFYSDAELTMPIGSANLIGMGGCARPTVALTTTWANLDTGVHPFWVKVDNGDSVSETDETDNVAQGVVIVNPSQVYLPVVFR